MYSINHHPRATSAARLSGLCLLALLSSPVMADHGNSGRTHLGAAGIPSTTGTAAAVASANAATAIGTGAVASDANAVAVGRESIASGYETTAIGAKSAASGAGSVALGRLSSATGFQATALGERASAGHSNSTAIGQNAATTRSNQVQIGITTTTYTLSGLPSATSRTAQGAVTGIITVDASGNIASDNGALQSTANTANTNATNAISMANTANTNAMTAETTAATAVSTANTAETTAAAAVSTANTAETTAATAVSTANTAETTAAAAVSTANTANTNAMTAETTAAAAVSTANTAETTAIAAMAAVMTTSDDLQAGKNFNLQTAAAAVPAGGRRVVVQETDTAGITQLRTLNMDALLGDIDGRVNKLSADLQQGLAATNAMAALPNVVPGGGRFALGIGTGKYGSAQAFAIGFAATGEQKKVHFNFGASGGAGTMAARSGLSMVW